MRYIIRILITALLCLTANYPLFNHFFDTGLWYLLLFPCYLLINIAPSYHNRKMPLKRYKICADGCELLILFLISTGFSIVFMLITLPRLVPGNMKIWLFNLLVLALTEAVVFWNGIIRVYVTSAQIGIKWRLIGILCGWLPILNIIVLYHLISIAYEEAGFESSKIMHNRLVEKDKLCKTKYPIFLVHGVFFRDFKYFNYWGRIPKELEKNGAVIYYGNHQSAASVADSGKELSDRIRQIVRETGCGKVNIIAHSKGGLDCRYAISCLGVSPFVASLTTINTPHRGCVFADYLLDKVPEAIKDKVAKSYNTALRKLGDETPDFMAAVTDLKASTCKIFNEHVPNVPGVYYQSVGSKLNRALDGRFPLNFSHQLVKYFDGPNDGLVAEGSFPWGENYTFLTASGKRGISHGDMIDLNRENIKEFDVREFYVTLVSRLRELGL